MYFKETSSYARTSLELTSDEVRPVLNYNFKGEPWAVPSRKRNSQQDHVYLENLKPLLFVAKALGVLPINPDQNGEMQFRLFSLGTLYAGAVQVLMLSLTVFTIFERVHRIRSEVLDFGDLVLEVGCIICCSFTFLAPMNHLPEAKEKAQFLNDWKTLQDNFHRVNGRPLDFNLRRRIVVNLGVCTAVAAGFTSILFGLNIGYKWWQGIAFFYSSFLSFFMCVYWVFTMDAFVIVANSMAENLKDKMKTDSSVQGKTVEAYAQLWLELSKLTQDMGGGMGYSYGGLITLYFSLQLIGTFGFISQVNQDRVTITLGFLSTSIIYAVLVFLLCSAAEKATNQVGISFQEKIRSIIFTSPMNDSTKTELYSFMRAISAYPPVINLRGFVQVNRSLQTSLMSATVTYLVVLTQFQQSS